MSRPESFGMTLVHVWIVAAVYLNDDYK